MTTLEAGEFNFVFLTESLLKLQYAEKNSRLKWALTSFPGSGVTFTRQLIEGVTGIYTGSVYLNDPSPFLQKGNLNCIRNSYRFHKFQFGTLSFLEGPRSQLLRVARPKAGKFPDIGLGTFLCSLLSRLYYSAFQFALYNNNTVFMHALGLWSIVHGWNILVLSKNNQHIHFSRSETEKILE